MTRLLNILTCCLILMLSFCFSLNGYAESTASENTSVSADASVVPLASTKDDEQADTQALESGNQTSVEAATVTTHTAPYSVKFQDISAGDTAWMMAATALVMFMTIPGLAMFYAGMVRQKNVLSTALQSFAIACLVTVLWVVVGYSLAFTPSENGFLGGLDRILLHGMEYAKNTESVTVSHIAPTIPESVFIMFQMSFAVITPALIVGAYAERMRFVVMLWFSALWSLLVYVPVAHWVWEPTGFFAAQGVLDFAGGTVVHINAGVAGLVAAYMLGQRKGYGKVPFVPFNLAYTLLGASLLWVGWFGFNAGSALAADGRAGLALLITQVAAASAALAWMLIEYIFKKRITLLGCASGVVAGLVAITPASGFVNLGAALLIGVASGISCYWGATGLKRLLGADDALDVFGIHGIGGIVGAILTGVFADASIANVQGDAGTQAIAAFSTLAYSGIMTLLILVVLDFVLGLRVTEEEEYDGLDLTQHAERIV